MKYNKLGEPIFKRLTEKSSFLQVAETAHELSIEFNTSRKLITCWLPDKIGDKFNRVIHHKAENFYAFLNDYMEERDLIKPLEPEI